MSSPSASSTPSISSEEYGAERSREEMERFRRNGSSPAPVSLASAVAGRTLPHSLEAEEYLLSCCLLDGAEVVSRCIDARIKPESFYEPKHGVIYEKLLDLYNRQKPIDVSVVAEELKTSRKLEAIDGYAFLVHVSKRVPTTLQTGYFIDKVCEQALLREIIRSAAGAVEDCYNFTGDINGFVSELETKLLSVVRRRTSSEKTYTVWSPAQFRAWTPPMELNLLGAGYLRRRQITTLIGPPGVGKSRLSLWLGVSHISQRAWCGLEPKGGALRWFFIGNENDPERQKNDLNWFYRNLTSEEQKRVDDQLFLHVLDSHEDSHLTLVDPSVYARLVATLRVVKPDVMVCDPWGNMIEANENDNEEVRRTLKLLLRAIAEGAPDAAVLIIHHARTGKTNTIEAGNNYSGGSLGRGSKVLVSQARCELALWPGDSEDASKLVLTCEKVNNAPKFEPVGLTFENGIYQIDGTFSVKAWRDDIEGKRSRRVLSVKDVIEIVKQGAVKSKDIVSLAGAAPFGATRSTVYERLKEAVAKGYLIARAGEYALPAGKITQASLAEMHDEGCGFIQNPNDPDDRV